MKQALVYATILSHLLPYPSQISDLSNLCPYVPYLQNGSDSHQLLMYTLRACRT